MGCTVLLPSASAGYTGGARRALVKKGAEYSIEAGGIGVAKDPDNHCL